VDPVPDPLFLRKFGSAGNRTWTSESIGSRKKLLGKSFRNMANIKYGQQRNRIYCTKIFKGNFCHAADDNFNLPLPATCFLPVSYLVHYLTLKMRISVPLTQRFTHYTAFYPRKQIFSR
jgi:hypothetical protein